MTKKITVLVNRTALNGNITLECNNGALEPAYAHVVKELTPGGSALSTMFMIDNNTF